MNKFLHLGGLESLLDALEQLSGKEFTNFGDAVLQLDCLACVRAVLNTNEGMVFLLRPEDLVRKLVIGEFQCVVVNDEIVEMCTHYKPEGLWNFGCQRV